MKKWKLIGGIGMVIAAAVIALLFAPSKTKDVKKEPQNTVQTVVIRYGSEKEGLLKSPSLQKILKEKYNIAVDGTKRGSLEMSEGSLEGIDGLWPSSELAEEVFKKSSSGIRYKSQNIFNTPIVFYSWPEVTDVLIKEGVVEKRGNAYYVVLMKKYLEMMIEGRTWKDIGLERQTGRITIHSTDPTKSNSGFLLTGLMAVILNEGEMPDETGIDQFLPAIQDVYKRMGYLENSTGILFDKYIKQGRGAFPIIAAYENQIIEFYQAYPNYQEQIRKMVLVLIPEPTVWSGHPFIALTKKGEKLLEALQDQDIQNIAWEKFGFRSGVMGLTNDPGVLKEVGLPEQIDSVTPLPSPEIMDKILTSLKN
jgi:hypothetical protein